LNRRRTNMPTHNVPATGELSQYSKDGGPPTVVRDDGNAILITTEETVPIPEVRNSRGEVQEPAKVQRPCTLYRIEHSKSGVLVRINFELITPAQLLAVLVDHVSTLHPDASEKKALLPLAKALKVLTPAKTEGK
jgi:hypothetical protein